MSTPRFLALLLMWPLLWAGSQAQARAQAPNRGALAEFPSITVDRLTNGMRVIRLPHASGEREEGNGAEIAFGYTVGLRNEPGYPSGIADLSRFYLSASVPARSVALVAHLGGGEFEFIDELDRVGMRVRVPDALVETVLTQVGEYFAAPRLDPEMFEYARRRLRSAVAGDRDGFGIELDRELGTALLRDYPYLWSEAASADQIDRLQIDDLETYFNENFGTDRAYVVTTETVPQSTLAVLADIGARRASHNPVTNTLPEPVETVLDLAARVVGGVVLARAVPSVHFEGWFRALVVDRLLRQVSAPSARFQFGPGVDPVLHRIDIPVEIPLFAEDVRDDLLDQITGMQFRNPDPSQLRRAVESAVAYLGSRNMLEWFAAHDLWDSLEAGSNVIKGLTGDGFRSAVRDFDSLGQVAATWPPAFEQPQVRVESLSVEIEPVPDAPPPLGRAPGRVPVPDFDTVAFPDPLAFQVETLTSELTLAEDVAYGIFIAGRFEGVLPGGDAQFGNNGSFWSFTVAPTDAVFDQLRDVRADRILVFAPAGDLPSLRRRFNGWTSGDRDSTPSLSAGRVATGDLPGLLVLKTWLDAKVVEAGWWGQVELRIEGIEGSRLIIDADAEQDAAIQAWIQEVEEMGLEDGEFLRVRSAALGYFNRIRRELQILLWQRNPQGTIRLPTTVNQERLRAVARIYF